MNIYTIFIIFIFTSLNLFAQNTVSVLIDLGGTASELPWNTLTNSSNGQLNNLIGSNGFATEVDLVVADEFRGTNTDGTLNADPSLDFPAFASGDSFFGNTIEWNGATNESAALSLSNLDSSKTYQLTLFASREAGDNRETQYNITSGNLDTIVYLDPSSNVDEVVTIEHIVPNQNNEINIQLTAGPNNNNAFGFFYLGIIQLQFEAEVVDTEPRLSLLSPNGGQYYQSGRQPQIRWDSKNISALSLAYSIDNGDVWNIIDTVNAFTQKFDWTIPDHLSENCLVRISSDNISSISQENFTIDNLDTTHCHIVVLGSSTAAGTGPTSVDSAWVWMYRDTVFQNDTRFAITNLARGGFTTYNILPDGAEIPSGVNQTIDPERNISKALTLNPDAIIINLPSNDAANGYPVTDQLANYNLILVELISRDIPFWIATPQPRNNFSDNQKQIQLDMRDSTFLRFEEFAVDFWTELNTVDNDVNPDFDSGDGVHLNNAGHRILLARILDKQIPDFLIEKKTALNTNFKQVAYLDLVAYPNPTSEGINVQNVEPPFHLSIYDINGRIISKSLNHQSRQIPLSRDRIQLVLIEKDGKRYATWVNKYQPY